MPYKICRDLNAFKPEELILITREIDFATKIACGSIERPLRPGESIDVSTLLDENAHTKYVDDILPQVRDTNATGETELERDAAENYQFVKNYSSLQGDPNVFTYEEILAGVKTEQAKPEGFKKKEMALNIRSSAFLHTFALNPEIKDESEPEGTTTDKPWNTPLVGALLVAGAAGLGYVGIRNAIWGLRIFGWGAAWGSFQLFAPLASKGFHRLAVPFSWLAVSSFGKWLRNTPRIPFMWRGGLGRFLWYFASRPGLGLGIVGIATGLIYGIDLYSFRKDPQKSWLKKQAVKYVDPAITKTILTESLWEGLKTLFGGSS